MANSTVTQAAKDEKDVFEQTAGAEFAAKFGGGSAASAPAGLIPAVAAGGSKEPGTNAFADWWAKDSTQEKVQGMMGSIGAIFGGMAGIPLGGGDMSSMERASVRAQAAPGEARQRMREKQFTRYIDSELGKTTDQSRRDLLMSVRQNPQALAEYLARETPKSKSDRSSALEKMKQGYREDLERQKHDYKMDEIGLKNQGRRNGVTANRADDIGTGNQLFLALSDEEQESFLKTGRPPMSWLTTTEYLKYLPHLYSPNGGILYNPNGEINFNAPKTVEVTGPDGEKKTVGFWENLSGWLLENWENLSPGSRRWYEEITRRHELEDPGSEEEQSVRKKAGLE